MLSFGSLLGDEKSAAQAEPDPYSLGDREGIFTIHSCLIEIVLFPLLDKQYNIMGFWLQAPLVSAW